MVNRTGIHERYVYINAGKMLSRLFVVLRCQSATNKNEKSVYRENMSSFEFNNMNKNKNETLNHMFNYAEYSAGK